MNNGAAKRYDYNVWLIVEKISSSQDEDGEDIKTTKLAYFTKQKDALDFCETIEGRY
jgi:hypothetical protein